MFKVNDRKLEISEMAQKFNLMHPLEQNTFIQFLKDLGFSGERMETLENLIKINTGLNSAI